LKNLASLCTFHQDNQELKAIFLPSMRIFLFLLPILPVGLLAQQPAASHLFGELAGSAGLYSVNYLHSFASQGDDQWEVRGGATFVNPVFAPVIGVHRLISAPPHRLVLGVNIMVSTQVGIPEILSSSFPRQLQNLERRWSLNHSPVVGYRWEPSTKWFLQVCAIGFISYHWHAPVSSPKPEQLRRILFMTNEWTLNPWAGIGFGWRL